MSLYTPSYTITPSQLGVIARQFIRARLNLLVVGEPGIGKTAILKAECAAEGTDLLILHPAVDEPIDYKGLPVHRGGEFAEFLPYGNLAKLISATKPTTVFFDDFGHASEAVQKALMQVIYERSVNGQKISDQVTFIAATNGRTHKAGVTGLLEPVKSRFAAIVHLVTDLDEWTVHAHGANFRPEVIAYCRMTPEHLSAFKPTADLTQSPSPRTWEAASKILDLNLPDAIRNPLLVGAIGDEAGVRFIGYLPVFNETPSIDGILSDPDGAPIPEKIGALHAVASGLSRRIDDLNFGNAWVYLQRLEAAEHGEIVSYILNTVLKLKKEVQQTSTWQAVAASPSGKRIQQALAMTF